MSSNKEKAIGVFDSGMGGLTCVKELQKLLPGEDIIYFGDTARVPYGTRSRERILEYARQDVSFIESHSVKLVIAACGTVSSAVGSDPSFGGDVPFLGVVSPAGRAAANATRNGLIGVIGTAATIRSGAYEHIIHEISPEVSVISDCCPLFVPMVEEGMTDPSDIVVRSVVERYLSKIKSAGVDTLILGCTHYPHLEKAISDYMGDNVTLISSGAAAAAEAKELLREKGLLRTDGHTGRLDCYTSDSAELFRENVRVFMGGDFCGTVERVSVEQLCSS